MRASRLVSILLLLQARGRMTAEALAAELEVSPRTIYRDIEALHAAGAALYGEPGRDGGYRLLDGYRTQLTGFTADEAAALSLAALPGIARELGLGAPAAGADAKLKAALRDDLRNRADHTQGRLYIDPESWYADPNATPLLATVADAVWQQRRLHVAYRRWQAPQEVERTLDPFGLVLKGGTWYLVARAGTDVRTYRVSQLRSVEPLAETFDRPAGFDLAGHWRAYLADFDARRHPLRATLRLSPGGLRRLDHLMEPAVTRAARESASAPDATGWITVTIPIESVAHAHKELLRLGAEAEVTEPTELRERLASTVTALASRYAAGPEPMSVGAVSVAGTEH